MADAARLAEQCGVEVALSQPCFEVWLILHKKDCRKTFQNAKEAERALLKILPSWNKSNLRMEDFWDDIEVAIRRAKALGDPPDDNPSTSVWKLMEFLRIADEATTTRS